MAALVELFIVDQFGVRPLSPTPRGRIELVREDAHCYRDRDVLGLEKRQLAFPLETRRRNSRVRQPVKGDVVDDVTSREAG